MHHHQHVDRGVEQFRNVLAGLVPAICCGTVPVDGRDRSGHDARTSAGGKRVGNSASPRSSSSTSPASASAAMISGTDRPIPAQMCGDRQERPHILRRWRIHQHRRPWPAGQPQIAPEARILRQRRRTAPRHSRRVRGTPRSAPIPVHARRPNRSGQPEITRPPAPSPSPSDQRDHQRHSSRCHAAQPLRPLHQHDIAPRLVPAQLGQRRPARPAATDRNDAPRRRRCRSSAPA